MFSLWYDDWDFVAYHVRQKERLKYVRNYAIKLHFASKNMTRKLHLAGPPLKEINVSCAIAKFVSYEIH